MKSRFRAATPGPCSIAKRSDSIGRRLAELDEELDDAVVHGRRREAGEAKRRA